MKDDAMKRDYFWFVEAIDHSGKVLYSGTFQNFNTAYDKYASFKEYAGKATVSLQRRFREYKVA